MHFKRLILIIYLEAYDDYVKIIVPEGTFLKKQTMGFYEKQFENNNFLRVHRSFLLQLNQITKVEPLEKNSHIAILKNGARIPLSRSGYAKLKEVLGL
ncbi:MAG: LytTR family DNA-binding domain-containing protein [Bacteroidota bacterium]